MGFLPEGDTGLAAAACSMLHRQMRLTLKRTSPSMRLSSVLKMLEASGSMAGSVFSRNPCDQHRGLLDRVRALQMQGLGQPLQARSGCTCWLARGRRIGRGPGHIDCAGSATLPAV